MVTGSVNLTNNNINSNNGAMILNHKNANRCSSSTLLKKFTNMTVPLQKVAFNASVLLSGISLNLSLSAIPSSTSISSGTTQNLTNSIRDSVETDGGGGALCGSNDNFVNPLPGGGNCGSGG